jgi:hypothetical protein
MAVEKNGGDSQQAPLPPKLEKPDNWRTQLLVGLVMAVAIVIAAFALTGAGWGSFCLGLVAFESWTLINKYRQDSISETLWEYAKRPLVPMLFGITLGWGAGSGYLGDPQTVGRAFAIGLLFGHFFFTPYRED